MYEKKCWKIAYVRISRKRGGGGVGGGSRPLASPKVSTYFKYIRPMSESSKCVEIMYLKVIPNLFREQRWHKSS